MYLKRAFWTVIATFFAVNPAMAGEPASYQPSGDWAIEKTDRYCIAERTFTRGEQRITLGYRMADFGPSHRLFLRATGYDYSRKGLFFRVMPHKEKFESYPADAEKTDDGVTQMSVWTVLGPKPKDRDDDKVPQRAEDVDPWLAEVETLKITRGLGERITIETGPLDQVRRDLQDCLSTVIESWGLDKEAHQSLTELAHPTNSRKWGNWLRYAINFENSDDDLAGIVDIRLMIDKTGEASSCDVYSVGIDREMARAICERLLKFGQFEPAQDQHGQAIDSFHQNTAVYHSGF